METQLLEWLNLAVRWIHMIVGIAWIGTSFYFNWLNHSFEAPEGDEDGVSGQNWQVHGGAFYRVLKYPVAPEQLPATLHWFKWEAYSTWISGFALLVIVYYFGADAYMVDPQVADIPAWGAVAIGLATLLGGWIIYDLLCRSPLARTKVAFVLVAFAAMVGVAYGLTRVLGSRAAYIHVGAMLGTIMAANVFRVIIPSQREVTAAMQQGREPDATLGRRAAQRSLHNNYITLPVLFLMVSNHYPFTYGHPYNWAILGALALVGAGVRHWFNLRHQGRRNVWILPAAAAGLIGIAAFTTASSSWSGGGATAEAGGPSIDISSVEHAPFSMVRAIIDERCTECHSRNPSSELYSAPPSGIVFETPEQIRARAQEIERVAVSSRTMPLGNLTEMTDHERAVLGKWIQQGARIE